MKYDARLILGGLIVIALVGGLFFWLVTKAPRFETPLTAPIEEEETEGRIFESSEFYEIEADYPTNVPIRDNEEAVTILKTFVENAVGNFIERGAYETLSKEDRDFLGYRDGRKQQLIITYEEYESAVVLSYVFTLYEDTFGAHGNTYFRTFTFDRESGESLTLSDLFAPGTDYLSILGDRARLKLMETLGNYADEEYIASGTLPEEESFQSFYLSGDALVLLFPPYQVAPYAAGPQEVSIPFLELGTTLTPRYR